MKVNPVRIKKIFTVIGITVALFFAATRANAQPGDNMKSPEERAKRMSEKMKTELSLTDEQYPKVEEINLRYAKKNEEIMKSPKGKLSKLKSVKSSRKEKNREMKTVLTKEQYKKYEELMDEAESRAKDRFKSKTG